jgi:hypothetical protein
MKIEIDIPKTQNRCDSHILLKTTHNGYQWSGITLYSESELIQLRDFINKYFEDKKCQKS